uniref:Tyrosine-protein phosphatase domain-containing protein n=1 Tax=Meloidogyne floridensis TaxID=298350 RepID=A0A915P605_9BILA
MTSRNNRNIVTAARGDTPRGRSSSGSTPRTTRQSSGQQRGSSERRRPQSRSGTTRQQGRPPAPERPKTVEESNEDAAFLEQLQAWAQETSRKQLTDLESEFERLQSQPRPEPSEEFARNPTLNRYRDVICVENNRVALTNGRYIHANWIDSQGNHQSGRQHKGSVRGHRGTGRQPSYSDTPAGHQRQSKAASECSSLPLETLARSWSAYEPSRGATIALLHREIQANSRPLFGRYWQDRDYRHDLLGSEHTALWAASGLLRIGG